MSFNFLHDIGFTVHDSLPFLGGEESGVYDGLLFIRVDSIGDFVVWLDAARRFRSFRNDTKITLIANSLWADLASKMPYFDEVIPLDVHKFSSSLGYRRRQLNQLRRFEYTEAINFVYTRRWHFATADALIRGVRADVKIGSEGEYTSGWRKQIANNWYTNLLPASDEPLPELRRNAEFLRHLGIKDFEAGLPRLPTDNLPEVDGLPSRFFVLVPGAGADYREWPVDRFSEIAQRIYNATGWMGVVAGSPSEVNLGRSVVQKAGVPVENWAGQTSVSEMASMIARSNLVVGNETSAIHIAVAVSTPSVCVLGGGHYGRFVPYDVEAGPSRPLPRVAVHEMPCFHCDWNCIYDVPEEEPVPCITNVSVSSVWEQVEDVLRTLDVSTE